MNSELNYFIDVVLPIAGMTAFMALIAVGLITAYLKSNREKRERSSGASTPPVEVETWVDHSQTTKLYVAAIGQLILAVGLWGLFAFILIASKEGQHPPAKFYGMLITGALLFSGGSHASFHKAKNGIVRSEQDYR